MSKLSGKVALITGAGQGVGQGIAYALAKEGAAIAVMGRTESKLVATVERIEAHGGKASAAVRWDLSNYGGYASIKEGMRALTRAAACEWGVDGVRVNALAPLALSPAPTGWMERFPEKAEEFRFDIPLRRVGDVETDVGRAVAFLAGEDAGYLTGGS